MRTPFAWRNLTHRKVRAAVALAGVVFSVLLVFMQTGFYGAIVTAAAAVYRRTDADIFLLSPQYAFINSTGSIPRERIAQTRSAPGVRSASSLFIGRQLWRNAETRVRNPMVVIGIEPASNPLGLPVDLVRQLGNGRILIDSFTKPRYGTLSPGTVTELGERQVEIVGQYRIGPGFAADGAGVVDDDSFVRIFPGRSIDNPSLGLVRLERSADPQRVAAALRALLPQDTEVLTREEMISLEESYWTTKTSLGPVFGAGAVLGLLIGIVIVYQVMATDIANHLPEYATLMALGYTIGRLRWIVLQEVSAFALAGYAVGWAISSELYRIVRDATGLPMTLSPQRLLLVLLATLLMCGVAGGLSTRQFNKADPADLY